MKTGLTVQNSVYQTHKNSVYQTIQFTKHYSTHTKNDEVYRQSVSSQLNIKIEGSQPDVHKYIIDKSLEQ